MNPTALVTGASRGIGRGIALHLSRIGYDLLLNFVSNRSAADKTAADCRAAGIENGFSNTVHLCRADISRSRDRSRLIATAKRCFDRLDLLVNNAGVAPEKRSDILEATEESFDRLIAINLKGPYFLTQLAAQWMLKTSASASRRRSPANRSDSAPLPKIVVISSISAYTSSVNRGDYCVSKAGLSMLTSLFAVRLAGSGINVYEIRPGIVATDMTQGVSQKYSSLIGRGLTPIRRWGQPDDVGRAVAAIAKGFFPFSTGQIFDVDGGFHLRHL